MERELATFQTGCEERLTAALARLGRRVAGRRLDGQSETYITGSIEGRNITFWIYEEGADFHAGKRHRLFERLDYGSLDDLAGGFVAKLTEVAA
jgi:hypothetical protein